MERWRFAALAVLVGLGLLAFTPSTAFAHGFGSRYDLPVPLYLYVTGAGAAVAFSFAVIGIFVRGTPGLHGYATFNLLRWQPVRLLSHSAVLFSVKLVAAFLLVLMIVAGLIGNQAPTFNLAPTLVWVVFWVGLSFVSPLVGNVWAILNPWKTLFGWAEGLYGRATSGGQLSRFLPYPVRLGIWPAVALFFVFAWVENVWPHASSPRGLAFLALSYSATTWAGMLVFGKQVWLRQGEIFSIVFGLLARFAPTEAGVTGAAVCVECSARCREANGDCVDCAECWEFAEPSQRQFNLRPFAAGLLRKEDLHFSHVIFVILVLATVTFDGLEATPFWSSVIDRTSPGFSAFGRHELTAVSTAGLLVVPVLFAWVYAIFSGLMAMASGERVEVSGLARRFVLSLVPIALAYNLAHFFSFLITQGQLVISLASDPLGRGWDLFGTAGHDINIGVVNARLVWFVSIGAIVVGHIVAVYLSHITAIRTFRSHAAVIRSQYPMLVLMVGYTMVSLWILAQPIVNS